MATTPLGKPAPDHPPDAAVACAIPRQINEDLVAVLTSAEEASALFGWLSRQPFVTDQGGRFQYHAVVRDLMLRLLRGRSPDGWRQRHGILAQQYADWRAVVGGTDPWSDPARLELRAEEEYHRFCINPGGRGPETVAAAVTAANAGVTAARRWAEVVRDAGRDCAVAYVQRLGEQLLSTVPAAHNCTGHLTVLIDAGILDVASRAEALTERGRIYGYTGQLEPAIADLTVAIELAPGDPMPLTRRGNAFRELRRYDGAITDLDRAVTLNPDHPGRSQRGRETYRRMGRLRTPSLT